MAYTTINKHTAHFNTQNWTGNGSARSFTGIGFAPDLVNTRARNATAQNYYFDKVRGVQKYIAGNSTAVEGTGSQTLTSFDSDGFSIGTASEVNYNGDTYVSYNFKANGQGSSNTDGSINTTYTSVDTTAGFSICKWTGNATNSTIGHGLGAVPKMIIIKRLTGGTTQWVVYHVSTGNTQACYLNTNSTPTDVIGFFNDTTPTSSVFTVGTDTAVNGSGNEMIAYCFAEKTGYSKFGSYKGNGNANGSFIYTGFRPSYLIVKQTNAADDWLYYDSGVSPTNVITRAMNQTTNSEATANRDTDFLSNGFKFRSSNGTMNESGATFLYMAIGQSLVGSNNVPCTAR